MQIFSGTPAQPARHRDLTSCICGGSTGPRRNRLQTHSHLLSTPHPPSKSSGTSQQLAFLREGRRDEVSPSESPRGGCGPPRVTEWGAESAVVRTVATGTQNGLPSCPPKCLRKLPEHSEGSPRTRSPLGMSPCDRSHMILFYFSLFCRITFFFTGFETHPQSIDPRYGRYFPQIIQMWCYFITAEMLAKFSSREAQKENALRSLPLPTRTQGHRVVPPGHTKVRPKRRPSLCVWTGTCRGMAGNRPAEAALWLDAATPCPSRVLQLQGFRNSSSCSAHSAIGTDTSPATDASTR